MIPILPDGTDAERWPHRPAELIEPWRSPLGRDFEAYRNHVFRVFTFGVRLGGNAPESVEKIAIAAVYHDLGIWTDRTFDYLPHSIRLARAHLAATGRGQWVEEIVAMIDEHHKITPYRSRPDWLVEPFRRADLVDLSLGTIRFGLGREFVREVRERFPNCSFHGRLAELAMARLGSDPFDPLPMMKW